MVDFDHRRPISGDISRGRKEKRKKKRENLEIQCCSPNLNPSPVGFSALRKENLWQSRGEETSPRILQNLSYSCFSKMSWPLICSADEEKNNRKSSMKYNRTLVQYPLTASAMTNMKKELVFSSKYGNSQLCKHPQDNAFNQLFNRVMP
ncbi:hypothetical protein GW17_00024598 [Ensete ventricosum]|nr:hypothetical protein GW17_00024598 [Ensete ventricosum]RZR77155.1 hypothetical protein BHM03_00002164 [Ensete ventricosum]